MSIALYCTVRVWLLHCTALYVYVYCTVLHCTCMSIALYYTVRVYLLHCTALYVYVYCTVRHCTCMSIALYCTALYVYIYCTVRVCLLDCTFISTWYSYLPRLEIHGVQVTLMIFNIDRPRLAIIIVFVSDVHNRRNDVCGDLKKAIGERKGNGEWVTIRDSNRKRGREKEVRKEDSRIPISKPHHTTPFYLITGDQYHVLIDCPNAKFTKYDR